MSDESLPVVTPPAEGDPRDATRVVGVLLAAGTSSRFGDANKLLATVGSGTDRDADGRANANADASDEPIVRRAARTLVEAGLDGVVVVVGHEASRVRAALAGLDATVLENPAYGAGQSTSVRAGVERAATAGADAVVVALGDMPFVAPAAVDALVATHAATGRSALAAAHEGVRGNPVLFDATRFDALRDVSGDVGGRRVLLDAPDAALVETGDPGVLADVDEPSDLESDSASSTRADGADEDGRTGRRT